MLLNKATAQVTWSNDVASIIYTNCSKCHNSNGIAPFPLMSYQDAADHALGIESAVQDKHMPPWPPDPTYSRLAHERVLNQQEIDAIVNWVSGGTLRGDSTTEPAAPVFSSSDEISSPDLTLTIPSYSVNTTSDLYRCFVLPSGLSSMRYITGMETVPGNRSIVHHVLIFMDTTNVPAQLDAADPGPGYTNFGSTGSSASKLIGVWVPGQSATFLPQGMGIRLPANANIILQIHYPGGISGQTDQTKINLQYTSSFRREVYIDPPLNHLNLDQGFLRIPGNTTRTFTSHYTMPFTASVMAVGPHMHLIGRSISSWGVTPTGDTIPFINIPEWDFHWQGVYQFPRILKVPSGTVLYSSAFYDNTLNNPHQPNNPPITVNLGEGTNDEMMLIYFQYAYYVNGDENIILDSTVFTAIPQQSVELVHTIQLYDPSPNPINNRLNVQYFLPSTSSFKLEIYGLTGEKIKTLEEKINATAGFYTTDEFLDLPNGIYLLSLSSGETVRSKRILINK